MTPRGRRVPTPGVIRQFHVTCTDCDPGWRQTFYDEQQRDLFARQHALDTTHGVLATHTEETVPCPT